MSMLIGPDHVVVVVVVAAAAAAAVVVVVVAVVVVCAVPIPAGTSLCSFVQHAQATLCALRCSCFCCIVLL